MGTVLSPHFSLEEMTFSDYAVRHDIRNEPDARQTASLSALAVNVLEPARRALGPIRVTSGYRCPELNAAIGGAPASQHTLGEAADCIPMEVGLLALFNWLRRQAPFDQLIWEFGQWIHVSFKRQGPERLSVLRAVRRNGRTVYEPMGPEVP